MVNKKGIYILWTHDQQFSKEELVVNPDHFPKLKIGDILEISPPNNPTKKLCLRVKTLAPVKGQLQISIAKYIASVFDFVSRREMLVNVIPDKNAVVDFVELSFKDQYIGRSDMWRLKLSLQNECVYVLKKLSFAQVRAQVEEMVRGGQKVSSGLIDDSTKFVFRSRSAKFILLIQMSKEMWDFSSDGDLYFEKAVNGFLKSLFSRWKSLSVNHTITIVLFSRTYYQNSEILDEVPNIPRNSQGVLFQDFYKVIVSDETRQDWSSVIVSLKREFNNYHQMVNWDIYGRNSALGQNSTSSQGNFLEAINLGMSYFDKHYIDRDFTRTGQMIVVVSPGTGIFEVDPDINLVTKQRMIDNGYGCDLICLNKHPLHIVPLFKYSNIDPRRQVPDPKSNSQYNVPYWLAISFYDDNINNDPPPQKDQLNASGSVNVQTIEEERFLPQFRIPEPQQYFHQMEKIRTHDFYVPKDPMKMVTFANQTPPNKYTSHNLGVSSYEDTIFNNIPDRMSGESHLSAIENVSIVDDYVPSEATNTESEMSDGEADGPAPSTPSFQHQLSNNLHQRKRGSMSIIKPSTSHERPSFFIKKNQPPVQQPIPQQQQVGSYGNSYEQKYLISRRQSIHHSQQPQLGGIGGALSNPSTSNSLLVKKPAINPFTYDDSPFHLTSNRRRWSHLWFSPNTYIFGKTNANPNPFLPNWKSLCEPASLPITTDYFPSQKDLLTKYQEYVHTLTLSPDDNEYHNNTEALLKELISQRLAQGYQLIMEPSQQPTPPQTSGSTTPTGQQTATQPPQSGGQGGRNRGNKRVYQLSLGHDFHVVTYDPSNLSIQVKRYQRHTGRNKPTTIKYTYFLCTAYHNEFIGRTANLSHQLSGSYPWNSLDTLICGTISEIKTTLKYWRVQYAVVPLSLVATTPPPPPPPQLPTNDQQQQQQIGGLDNSGGSVGKLIPEVLPAPPQGATPVQTHALSPPHSPPPQPLNQTTATTNITNINLTQESSTTVITSINSPTITTTTTNTSSINVSSTITSISSPPNLLNNNKPLTQLLTSVSAPTSPVSVHKTKQTPQQSIPSSSTGLINPQFKLNHHQPNQVQSATTSPNTSQEVPTTTTAITTPTSTSTEGFVVVEQSEDERIVAFGKFKEYINSLIAKNSNQKQEAGSGSNRMEVKAITQNQLNVLENSLETTTPLTIGDPSLGAEQSVREKIHPSNLPSIFARMNIPPPIGLKLIDRKHIIRTYRKCFVGSEAIDWMTQNVELNTREEALKLAQHMLDTKFIKSVEKAVFADGFFYYRLKEDENLISLALTPMIKQSSNIQKPKINNNDNPTNSRSSLTTSDGIENNVTSNVNINQTSSSSLNQSTNQSTFLVEPNSPKVINNTTSPILSEHQQQQLAAALTSPSHSPSTNNSSNNRQQLQMSNSYYESSFSPTSGGDSSSLKNSLGATPPITNYLNTNNSLNSLNNSLIGFYGSNQSNSSNNVIETYENPNQSDEEKIEMDSTKTDRYEWIMMKHDKSYSVSRFFHIEFKWMVCTGCVVDDFISSCIRKAKQVGLTLIQIPIEKNYSPFYAPIHIKLVPKLMQMQVLKVILSQFHFIPDHLRKRPSSLVTRNDLYLFTDDDVYYTEYIHRTGMLFVRIVEDGFLCIINNAPSNRTYLPAALLCLKEFQELITKLNATMPGIICSDLIHSTSPLDDPLTMANSASPQTNLLRSLPPQEANFLSLFAKGYTNRSDDKQKSSLDSLINNGGEIHLQFGNNITASEGLSDDELDHSHHADWEESQEILYYNVMSRSPTI